MTPAEHNRVIARAVTQSILGIVLVITLYLIRDVLLTLYISSLLAIGLSPLVLRIEHSRLIHRR